MSTLDLGFSGKCWERPLVVCCPLPSELRLEAAAMQSADNCCTLHSVSPPLFADEPSSVFFYVFAGIASVASFTLATTNPVAVGADGRAGIGVGIFGSIFSIGWAFAFGIAFAIITCGQVSGGTYHNHFTSVVNEDCGVATGTLFCLSYAPDLFDLLVQICH
jgi:hypothetical protein